MNSVRHSVDDELAASRWMYDSKDLPRTKLSLQLYKVKKAQLEKRWSVCYSEGEAAKQVAKGLRFWIEKVQLECLNEWGQKSKTARKHLQKLLYSITQSKKLLVNYKKAALLNPYLEGQLLLLERESKTAREAAWKRIDRLQVWDAALQQKQLARLYFLAGELAFVEQKLLAAFNFFQRSLSYSNDSKVLDKLALIEKSVPRLKRTQSVAPSVAATDPSLNFTEQELQLVQRMKGSLAAKDLVSAVEDGVKIIQNYPGSANAEWAEDQILSVYLGVIDQSDKRFELYRQKVLNFMKAADPQRLKRWAQNAWARGAYKDAVLISEMALDKLNPHPEEKKLLLLAATSAVSGGDYATAIRLFKNLIERHGGTSESTEALFRIGLVFYRQKDYSQSASYFEKLIATQNDSKFLAQAMYWKWRAYQKFNKKEEEVVAQQLLARFPLTYYGLRAFAELHENQLIWDWKDPKTKQVVQFLPTEKITAEFSFTQFEFNSWERFRVLLAAGWLPEAQIELKNLPPPATPAQQAIYAKFSAAALDHFGSITRMNQLWDEDTQFRTLNSVNLLFPEEFESAVIEQEKAFGMPRALIRGLIRQESSFRPNAVSPSQAYGLMQIIPLTARDIVGFLRIKSPVKIPEDLLDVSTNIKFGTSYLSRMVNAFDGHVPLALAAYNAGIGRMRRWMNARADIGVSEKNLDSSPESEIWIDEMPWSETRHYVKAVLRNYLIYQMIDEKKLELPQPVWKVKLSKGSSEK